MQRWVALELNKRAWGLFWAGGGLQRCRELLAERASEAEISSALVPATPEALLRLVLDLEPEAQAGISASGPNPWKLVAWTSLAWMAVLGLTVAGFLRALERQDEKLELLLQRTTPVEKQAE